MDRSNAFRETIEGDGVVLGARSATFAPTVIELYGSLGLDFVWLDFEHTGASPWDSHVFEHLTRTAEVSDIQLVVRIPSGDPPLVRKVLDAGVRNLLIPRVDSAEEVRRAVEASRFVYDGGPGQRGKSGGRARGFTQADEYVEGEDASVCVGVMIEKTTAVDDLDAILDVPDLGFVFIGPSDLSVQMGHPTERSHSDVWEQVEDVRERAKAAGVPVGGISHDPDGAAEMIEDGYQVVRIGGELESTQKILRGRLERIRGEE